MSLIKSISGIRGTIGGSIGDNLTPQDIVDCTAAFGAWTLKRGFNKVVVGRDARMSGEMVLQLVNNTLIALGIDVVNLGISTTPTVEIAVPLEGAGAGIIITASHNPKQWNALKFLNEKGEFISAQNGQDVLNLIENGGIEYCGVDDLGTITNDDTYMQKHIDQIFALPLVNVDAVKAKKFKVVVDCINSSGTISVLPLCEQLGCEVIALNTEMTGDFAHNPEPLPANLVELSEKMKSENADLGIVVDPDVDRLAFVDGDGNMFGEEYTLVAVADYILKHNPGNTVSNLSSTKALSEITVKSGNEYFASAVGEVNVVQLMKDKNAVIGGEGNGGIIYPELHYGRDALVGIALFLSQLVEENKSVAELKAGYPDYTISKNKIDLTPQIDIDHLLVELEERYKTYNYNTIDGLKIHIENDWVHLRKSNTEPIIRVYSESDDADKANALAARIQADVKEILA